MIRKLALLTVFAGMTAAGVVIDRIAVIVGKHAIKLSDIDRDLRVTQFLNREPLKLNSDARRQAAGRLIDQVIIGDEIKSEGLAQPTGSGADGLLNRLRRDRFGGSDARLRQELLAYGLTDDGLRAQLLWQFEVLQFIDQRFRPGVLVTDEEVRTYFTEHRSELARQYPQRSRFEELEPQIRAALEGERINQNFVQWLDWARQRNRIEYRQRVFQ
jgi:hypothetical protein